MVLTTAVQVWGMQKGDKLHEYGDVFLSDDTEEICAFAVDSSQSKVFFGGDKGNIVAYYLRNWRKINIKIEKHESAVNHMIYIPYHHHLVTAGSDDIIFVFDDNNFHDNSLTLGFMPLRRKLELPDPDDIAVIQYNAHHHLF